MCTSSSSSDRATLGVDATTDGNDRRQLPPEDRAGRWPRAAAEPPDALSRRRFARLSLGAAAALGLAGCGRSVEPIDTVDQVDFDNPLRIPPLAESRTEDGRRIFDLTARPGRASILPEAETATWGVDGDFLGPTLRAHRGEDVVVTVRNDLPEATALHWHGMHLPAVADGGPHQMIAPGSTWSPSWTVDQPAATLWYHPHPHGATEAHTYRGIGGLFVLTDDRESRLDLPRDYGEDDIPVIVQDKAFDEDAQLIDGADGSAGMLGDTILVNGTLGPHLEITAERTRLRLLNASTARSYAFGFSDERGFAMIAGDGGLLPAPLELTRLLLTPGERAEIVVTVESGDEPFPLRSFPHDLGVSGSSARDAGAEDSFDLLELRPAQSLSPSPPVPQELGDPMDLTADDAENRREFVLRDNRINGLRMDMGRLDEVVHTGATELWEVTNIHSEPHNFHVHGVQFGVLSIDDAPPPPELAGWKDTVRMPPEVGAELIMRFGDHADPEMPFMYHCHLLRHEDDGMMGQFVIIDPGQTPALSDEHDAGHEH